MKECADASKTWKPGSRSGLQTVTNFNTSSRSRSPLASHSTWATLAPMKVSPTVMLARSNMDAGMSFPRFSEIVTT